MIGAAIGAATALASSIMGAVSSANANRRSQNLINTEKKENQAWYDLKKNQQYTQRSDFQAIMKKQKELLDEQYANARGVNTVAGGTEESVAMQKKAANQSLSDTMTTVAGQASAYKDSVEQQYQARKSALTQQQVASEQNRANQVAQAAGQAVQAGLGLIGTDLSGSSIDPGNPNAGVKSKGFKMAQQEIMDSINKMTIDA